LGIAEIIALIGVLGTLAGTIVGTALNYVLTKRREDETRRRGTKQQAYEEYAALALLPDRFFDEDQHPEQYVRALSRMDLYGGGKVRKAARRMFDLALERNNKQPGSSEYESLTAQIELARTEFLDAAREELGYPKG
jgi:hypothetical protein